MANVLQVDAHLVLEPSVRSAAKQRERRQFVPIPFEWSLKSLLDPKFSLRGSTILAHTIFYGDPAPFVFAQRGINDLMLAYNMSMNDRQVLLVNLPFPPKLAQLAGGIVALGHNRDAAGFA